MICTKYFGTEIIQYSMFENHNFKRFEIEKLSKCWKYNGSNQKSVVPKFQVQIKYCKTGT